MAAVTRSLAFGFVVAAAFACAVTAYCCPFCDSVGQTLSQEIASMDAVVIAKLIKNPPPADLTAGPGAEIPKATFEVLEVLKGTGHVEKGAKIETIYIGRAAINATFMICAVGPEKLLWSTPVELSATGLEYLKQLPKLPKDGADRLDFFQKYLENADPVLNRDAYEEFAAAPYQDLIDLKPRLNHDQLVKWIQDVDGITPSKRRLYLTMLGVCGGEQDLPMLEKYISATNRKEKGGLDALIACYLTLKGDDGLKLVEDLFLKNPKADFSETYAAVMSLRFHATEGEKLSQDKIVKSLRYMLDRPQLADLVIPDLARLEDWDSADKLMELYRRTDEQSGWVRVPIVQFLRVCPDKERAEKLLKECEKIDPQSVEKAKTFLPLGGARPASPPPAKDKATEMVPVPKGEVRRVAAEIDAGEGLKEVTPGKVDRRTASVNLGAPPAEAAIRGKREPFSLWYLLGVPGLIGLTLIATQWRIMHGAGRS